MKNFIAVYGGSFNPSTNSHREIGIALRDQLRADEVWYLVSPQNPLKPKAGMAPFAERVEMARLNTKDEPGLVVKTLEAAYLEDSGAASIETAETLRRLTKAFPQNRFVFAMGADNLASIQTWAHYDYILDNFPIVVIPRSGHTRQSTENLSFLDRSSEDPGHIQNAKFKNGIFFLKFNEDKVNATVCRDELAHGQRPESMRPDVISYAVRRGLYAQA